MLPGIDYDEAWNRARLLQEVKKAAPSKVYKVDEMARRHNVEVLRLPPYHPDLNPIERVWAFEKVHFL